MNMMVSIHYPLIKGRGDCEMPVMDPIKVMCGLSLISGWELLLFPVWAGVL